MKKITLLLIAIFSIAFVNNNYSQVFWTDNFDTVAPTSGTRTAINHANTTDGSSTNECGSGDYFFRTNFPNDPASGITEQFSGFSGFYWRGEDLDGCFGNPDVINFTGIDISGRSNLSFKGLFGAGGGNRFEDDDSLIIEYSIDGGGVFVKGIAFESDLVIGSNGNLRVDTNLDGNGDGALLTTALTEYGFSIPGTGTTLSLRLTARSNSSGEEFAFDTFTLESSVSNIPPTFTSLAGVVDTTNEDTAVGITFAEIAAQGNEADSDGTVDAFVVKAVSTGSLMIDGTAFVTGINDEITASKSASWTPAMDAVGTLNAFTITAKDNEGAESTTAAVQAMISVSDTSDPLITCPSDIITGNEAGVCSNSTLVIGMATASDNVGVVSITNDAPVTFPVGATTVTWTASDAAGNTDTCMQNITIIDNELPMISCPSDLMVQANEGENFASGVNLGIPFTSDNCGVASLVSDAPATFPLGATIVTWTVTDTAGNPQSCQQTITVTDSTPPTVTSVSSPTVDGTYGVGSVIAITTTFSEAVTVTGTPQLTIETGATDRTIDYMSGTGTATLTFNYTVQFGDVSTDLDYVATNSLTLNTGTISDAAGNNAFLTLPTPGAANSIGANKAIVIDGVVPADPVVTTPASAITVTASTQTLSGTHTENGVTVHAYIDANNDGFADNTTSLGSAIVTGNAWSFSVNLTADEDNNFVVQAEDSIGNASGYVDVPTITEETTLNNEIFEAFDIEVLVVNPVRDEISIKGDVVVNSLEVYSLSGALVATSKEVTNLSSGIYIAIIKTEKGVITKKIIKE